MDADLPEGWHSEPGPALLTELKRELHPQHPLWQRPLKLLALRHDRDDILVAAGTEVAVVHLTWSRRMEVPGFPSCSLYPDLQAWLAAARADEA
ncbi:MAG: hypothetical protein ACAI44_31590 [Candidatus Sericytochromatia bacterium]